MRMSSIEAFLGSVFLYAKASISVLLFLADGLLCATFVTLAIFLHVLCPQPDYKGPSAYMFLNEITLDDMLKKSKNPVIVTFFTTWSPPYIHIAPIFADISIEYKQVASFAKVDVGRYPLVAKKHKINTDATSRQLPTIIKFVGGQEVCRMPAVSDSGVENCAINKESIVKTFELKELLGTNEKSASQSQSKKSKKE